MFGILTVYLVAIVVLLYAYVYVWSRGPQDGRLWRMIRRLRKETRYWRKRALRDEAILSRVIDKKTLALVAFLCLFLISVANPSLSSIPTHRVNESFMVQESPFLTAADGAESSDSIELFAETLDDDVMFTPDLFENNTDNFGTSFTAGTWPAGILASTHAVDVHAITAWTDGGVGWIQLNFTEPCGHIIEGWNWNVYAKGHTDDDWSNFSIYNWDTHSWDYQSDVTKGSYTWLNGTTYDPDYWSGSECAIRVQSEDSAPDVGWAYINCTVSRFYIMTLADSDHYAEPFNDVSDWGSTLSNHGTDGDVGYYDIPNDNGYDYFYTDDISLPIGSYYVEIRIRDNVTAGSGMGGFYLWSGDDPSGSSLSVFGLIYLANEWTTYRCYIETTWVIECVSWRYRDATNAERVSIDYLRIGNSTSMGWQHDGSTTAGVTDGGGGSSSGGWLPASVTLTVSIA